MQKLTKRSVINCPARFIIGYVSARCISFVLSFFVLLVVLAANCSAAPASHDWATDLHSKTYWRAISADAYSIPEHVDAMAHMRSLVAFSTSPDPELRDDIGYENFWRWVHRSGRFTTAEFNEIRTSLVKNALVGMGEQNTDSVFGRSFALLYLKELATADFNTPFLTDTTFAELLSLACDSLAKERDLRGYVAEKGWAHPTAHAADLLKSLARSTRLRPEQIPLIVNAVLDHARATTSAWVWGEDARLGAVLATLASRPDMPITLYEKWISTLLMENKSLWKGSFEVAQYRRVQAQSSLVTQMAALLTTQPATKNSAPLNALLATAIAGLR